MRTCLTFFWALGALHAQQLQSRYAVLTSNPIGPMDLVLPYTAGSDFPSWLDLDLHEELSIRNMNNAQSWCICARLTPTQTGGNPIKVILGDFLPNGAIDLAQSVPELIISTTNQPFISGNGNLNMARIRFSISHTTLPNSSLETIQVLYTVISGPCPVNNL